jgi:hypothetical protein
MLIKTGDQMKSKLQESRGKKIVAPVFVSCLIGLIGCGSAQSFVDRDFALNVQKQASVGSSILQIEAGWMNASINTTKKNRGLIQELVYGGVSNRTIKLLYREYLRKDQVVIQRPSYSQELQYDLNESNVITFRAIKLRVDSANNNQITFVVLECPDPPIPE